MADRYVWNAAVGTGTGASWANAHITLAAAITASTAGDRFFVAHDHAETQATQLVLTFKGTRTNPDQVLCVNRAGSVPPVSADLRKRAATVTTTGTVNIILAGSFYCYGIIFSSTTSGTTNFFILTTAGDSATFEGCSLRQGSASAQNLLIGASSGASWVRLIDTTRQAGGTGQGIAVSGVHLEWRNTPSAITGAAISNTMFNAFTTVGSLLCEGVDFSAMGSGKTLVGALTLSDRFLFKDCKLGALATIASTPSVPAAVIDVICSDSGDTNYRQERYSYQGTQTTETTIVRTGGATDGTTPIAWAIVTTANPKWHSPFECFPITIWNETVGSAITLTVECVASAVLNNDDIWMDVEYLGTSGFPLGIYATSGKADILATGTANTTSIATWGGALTGKFKLVRSITPQEKGWIYVYPKVAKASTTVYIDPEITVS